MHYDVDARDNDLVDLGSVVEETKGGVDGFADSLITQRDQSNGLQDD